MSLLASPSKSSSALRSTSPTLIGIQALLPLQLTCKYLNSSLGITTNPHIFASYFASHHDVSSARPAYAAQLLRYTHTLARIRSGDIHADDVCHTFWTSYLMLLEDDGKNRASLEAAGLPEFVDRFVREHLYDGHRNGWPADNAVNSLALWLLWLTTTEGFLVYVLDLYPSAFAPDIHFSLPLSRDITTVPHSVPTLQRPIPPLPIRSVSQSTVLLRVRLGNRHTACVYRRKTHLHIQKEVFPVGVPTHIPRNRQHALQLGLTTVGPTQEDVPRTQREQRYSGLGYHDSDQRRSQAPSARWDNDWNRLVDCTRRFQAGPPSSTTLPLETLLRIPQILPSFNEQTLGVTVAPVFMRLRDLFSAGKMEDGKHNAWLPASMRRFEHQNELTLSYTVQDPTAPHRRIEESKRYRKYVPDGCYADETTCRGCLYQKHDAHFLEVLDNELAAAPLPDGMDDAEDMDVGDADDAEDDPMSVDDGDELVVKRKCDGIMDIVLIGEACSGRGIHNRCYGRVREWDGLIALVRVPANAGVPACRSLDIYGVCCRGQTLVGNWRTSSHPGEPVTFEGAFRDVKKGLRHLCARSHCAIVS
ncbi:hypothetical protein BKA82DRAFT_4098882 [Pisolithus tinctorius]|nr:hypothetical protein BKA82DRAFT_4098882 [Pisolithus tinctorius]